MNVLNGGVIDLGKLMSYVDQTITNPAWNPVVKKVFNDCHTRTAGKTEDLKRLLTLPGFVRPEDCNVGLMAFIECGMNEIDVACPAQFEKKSKECLSTKEALIKCNSNIENVVMSFLGQIPAAFRAA